MLDINILQGKIVEILDVFVEVELYHIEPTQIIKALKVMPMFINSEEQEMNIKEGTEVLLIGWGIDSLDNFAVLGSTNNGIKINGKKITKIENLEEVQLIAPKITICNNDGGRDTINSSLISALEHYIWAEEIKGLAKNTTFESEEKFNTLSEETILDAKKKTDIITHTMKIRNEAGFDIIGLIGDLMTNVIKLEAKHGAVDTIPLKAKLETFR